jgi:hypothetical protein
MSRAFLTFPFVIMRFCISLCLVLGVMPSPAQTGNHVTINSDNVLVINEKKVFPIGFTLGPPPDAKTLSGTG